MGCSTGIHFFFRLDNFLMIARFYAQIMLEEGDDNEMKKNEILKKISLSLLNWMRFCEQIMFSKFLFLFSKLEKISDFSIFFLSKIPVLFSNQKTDLDISLFSSRNSRCGFHISLSLLDLTFWHLVNAWHSINGKSCELWHTKTKGGLYIIYIKVPF